MAAVEPGISAIKVTPMGPVAELAGSPALVALSPSTLSLLPVSFPAQSGSDLQLPPLQRVCGLRQSQ